MNVKFTSLLASALFGAVLASSSYAQEGSGNDGARDRARAQGDEVQAQRFAPRGRHWLGPRGFRPRRVIDRLDNDGDTMISFEEFSVARVAEVDRAFERLDRNGDGRIAVDELDRPRRAETHPQIDVTALRACVQESVPDHEPAMREERFNDADADGDGYIDLAELSAALDARIHAKFERVDADGDGFVDEAELRAQRELQRDLRRARRACLRQFVTDSNQQ